MATSSPASAETLDAIRTRVLARFNDARAASHASFDSSHFLDFLLADPSGKRAVYNSFSGLRRLNRFYEDVQLDHAICFSMEDRDANYSLDRIVARIDELQRNPKSSLVSLRIRRKHAFGWNAVIFANVLAFPLWMAALRIYPPIGWGLIALCILGTGVAARTYVLDKAYLRRLGAQLDRSM